MKSNWQQRDLPAGGEWYLVADVGGTNTNIGLIRRVEAGFKLGLECVFVSQECESLLQPLEETLKLAREQWPEISPRAISVCAAGPVRDNHCQLTNLNWAIDGAEMETHFKMPAVVINDFLGVSYGVPLLDVDNPEQITRLPNTHGYCPERSGHVSLVVGAGTGLGVGFTIERDGQYMAYPSEGGHASFADFDVETAELKAYLTEKNHYVSEIEQFISGGGIANIFHYFVDVRRVIIEGDLQAIAEASDYDKPALIAARADVNPVCRDILRLFIKIYGRITADYATILLPTNGIYLAGGIVSKNAEYFLEGKQFMYYFEQNFRATIGEILKTLPVYLIRDYSVSLYGAANAAVQLIR